MPVIQVRSLPSEDEFDPALAAQEVSRAARSGQVFDDGAVARW